MFLKGMTGDSLTGTFSKATNIPELGFFCFQATFAAITPALIVGAFAERVKFGALLRVRHPLADLRVLPDRAHGLVLVGSGCVHDG